MAKAKAVAKAVAEIVASEKPTSLTQEETFFVVWRWNRNLKIWSYMNEYDDSKAASFAVAQLDEPYHILKITLPAI